MEREALKLALEALEELNNTSSYWWHEVDEATVAKIDSAITAIKETLAQPAQEPVAYASIKMRVGNIYAQQFITQEMLHNADDPWRLITIYAEQCIEELKEKNT